MSSSGTTSRCANALFSALTETNISTHAVVAPSVAFFFGAEQPPDAEDDKAEPNDDGAEGNGSDFEQEMLHSRSSGHFATF
ncbi:hypothetical protein BS47DRAFT_1399594 [Hydnum rufescens UP504]|uniref:Uncharacterized protein n=1 Tax=Hydnum rufescens UP504 TaxID=1448309 RepID=A0A9P6AJ85_9AGAM|nr:hypothetical protein BS47DRAFT_1399594 [Hydnum rufescens UP504]